MANRFTGRDLLEEAFLMDILMLSASFNLQLLPVSQGIGDGCAFATRDRRPGVELADAETAVSKVLGRVYKREYDKLVDISDGQRDNHACTCLGLEIQERAKPPTTTRSRPAEGSAVEPAAKRRATRQSDKPSSSNASSARQTPSLEVSAAASSPAHTPVRHGEHASSSSSDVRVVSEEKDDGAAAGDDFIGTLASDLSRARDAPANSLPEEEVDKMFESPEKRADADLMPRSLADLSAPSCQAELLPSVADSPAQTRASLHESMPAVQLSLLASERASAADFTVCPEMASLLGEVRSRASVGDLATLFQGVPLSQVATMMFSNITQRLLMSEHLTASLVD